MLALVIKDITKNTMYIVQEPHIFYNHLELNYKSLLDARFSRQYFHFTLQLICQLTFFNIYSFYILNIRQHHMIYPIHIHNC